jgi:hypothetical protein
VNSVDGDGNPVMDITVDVQNIGSSAARGITVRATAFYCARPFNPSDGGGSQEKVINSSLPVGGHDDVTLRVRVNTYNDTSILVEKVWNGRKELVAFLDCKKPVFIRDAYISGDPTGHPRQANVTIQIFNSGEPRQPTTLNIVAISSMLGAQIDSEGTSLTNTLGRNETWLVTLHLTVPEVPSIEVQLFENGGATILDTAEVNG